MHINSFHNSNSGNLTIALVFCIDYNAIRKKRLIYFIGFTEIYRNIISFKSFKLNSLKEIKYII